MKKVLVVLLALTLVFAMTGMGLAKPIKTTRTIRTIPIGGGGETTLSHITQKARIINEAYASSGPAVAVGNVGVTIIKDVDSSASSCSGCATNNANITVTNTGIAGAVSGDANATNSGTNSITQSNTVTQSNTNSSTLTGPGGPVVIGEP
ncbi:MAG: hypothetical protein ACYC56_02315 [Candidatus Aquicultor sp.]